MIEVRLEKGRAADRRRIRELGLPDQTLISSIVRSGRIIAPKGDTVVRADDVLFILAPTSAAESLLALLNGRRVRTRRSAAGVKPASTGSRHRD